MTRWPVVLAATLAPVAVWAGTPKASTELVDEDGHRHPAALAFDGLLQTGWAEGEMGSGGGSWIELDLDRPTEVRSISIWPGNLSQGARSLREYGRPRAMSVDLIDRDQTASEQVTLVDLAASGPVRVDVPIEGTARTVRVTVDSTYEGFVFNDTYIAEIAVNFTDGEAVSAVERLVTWQASDAAARKREVDREEVLALYDRISEAEFGDRLALQEVMDRAGDGARYLRERVLALVPEGYRVHALPPDQVAVDAILKLKDPNGIPALEMAALRMQGEPQRVLAEKIEVFYAYQELIGGGNRNIPYWGQSGWELGALRSFGEPLGVEVDALGYLHVADLGNHRIQRFTEDGRADRIWGSEPAITNRWFDGERTYYVSGSEPSDAAGRFITPVDIEMVPGKEYDSFAVLDAAGRVQLFDEQGEPVIGWTVRSDESLYPGVGGEGYLEYVRNKLVVIWGTEVFVYGLDSEELDSWELDERDGVPKGAEVLRNGKLGVLIGDELVVYSLDGFRHGRANGDELGVGFEGWDITLDQDRRLWAVTDTGYAVKYKKPGKVDYALQITDYSLESPRIAVRDDVIYVVADDRILRVDALEMKALEELAAEEAASP